MDERDLLWKQYALNVDLYKFYLELVVKVNAFYYAIRRHTRLLLPTLHGAPLALRCSPTHSVQPRTQRHLHLR